MSTQPAELLKLLTIERTSAPKPRRTMRPVVISLTAISAFIVTFVIWFNLGDTTIPQLASSEIPSATAIRSGADTSPVETAPNSLSTVTSNRPVLDATGYVVARRAATVSAKTTGKVSQVFVEEGMPVSRGQIIARLDDASETSQFRLVQAQVGATQALAAELDAQIIRARLDLRRWSRLGEKGMASRAQLDDLEAEVNTLLARQLRAQQDIAVAVRRVDVQQVRIDDLTIRAPFDGIVVKKSAQPGEMISPVSAGGGFTRTGICTIVDMNSLEVEVDVNESYINRVATEQPVEVRLNAYPQQPYPGKVLAVIPTADRNKATIRVRIGLLNTDEHVFPDMGVQVTFFEFVLAES